MPKIALILVDLQNDFCAGGALPAENADEVIPIANSVAPQFELIVATLDWHPQTHASFASNHPQHQVGDVIQLDDLTQVLWPNHCVQDSKGAEFHPDLDKHRIHKIIYKGTHPKLDSYSGFHDNAHRRSTGLADYLREQQVGEVFVMGLATDYCVKFTCLDAIDEGFAVTVIEDGCRGVNLNPQDSQNAIAEMKAKGVKFVSSADLKSE